MLGALKEQNPESVRITISRYVTAVLLNMDREREVPRLLDMLAAFSKPIGQTEGFAPIVLAVGDLMPKE